MVSSRRSRVLALSAVLLTLMFIFITTHKTDHLHVPEQQQSSQKVDTKAGFQGGGIDEKFIKSQEEKLKQDIQKAKTELSGSANSKSKQDSANKEASKEGEFDSAKEFANVMSLSPVVIFSKTYCGFSKALKNLLQSEYEINPAPTIVELDIHKHGRELQDYIAAKTGRKTVPNLFVNGISRGGSDEMKKLHNDGDLLKQLQLWGEKNIKVEKVNAPSNS